MPQEVFDQITILTVVAAWWGAIIASMVFIWDIIKWWRSGPKLRIAVDGGVILMPVVDNKLYIRVEIDNIGDKPTTLKGINFKLYKNAFARYFGKSQFGIAIMGYELNRPELPHELDVGKRWLNLVQQTDQITEWSNNGYLVLEVSDSYTKRPYRKRLK